MLDVFFDANGNIRSPHTPTEMPVLSLATEQEVVSETPKPQASETPKPQAQPTTILGSNGAEDEEEDWP